MRFLLFVLTSTFATAQIQSIEMYFEGVNCVPCVESMPARAQRIRGVETATADPGKGVLTLRLAAQNRVRIEQIRDLIEQDGTKAKRAVVEVSGTLTEDRGVWLIKVPQWANPLELASKPRSDAQLGS